MSLSNPLDAKPRVAIIATGELFGGVEQHIVTLCRSLSPVPVLVVLFNEGLLADRLREMDVNIAILERRARVDRHAIRKLRDLLDRSRIQVVHVHGYVATVYLYLACGATGPAVVKTEHGLVESYGLFSLSSWKARVYRWLEVRATRKLGAYVVFVSRDIQNRTGPIYRGLDSEYVPNGIDMTLHTAPRPPEYPPGRRIAVGVGRLEPVKGFDIAIEAFGQIAPIIEDLDLIIVGDGPQREALSRRISDLGLAKRILLVGFKSNIQTYLSHADVLVMPSRHEGLPFVLLEAMLCGTPVIAAKTGGLTETITHGTTGLLFRAGDSEDLARSLQELLGNEGLKSRLAEEARKMVTQSYSGPAMAARYAYIFQQRATHSAVL